MSRSVTRRWLLAGAPLAAGLLSGCTYTGFAVQAVQQEDALTTPTELDGPVYGSVDRMIAQLRNDHPHVLKEQTPAVVGSIVDIRTMDRATPLGNIIADLVRARLVQHDVPVRDMRLRSSVKLSPSQGELVLSRNASQVYPAPAAGIICTGTYAVARSTVFVSLKMIRATNAEILAAADFSLPRTFDVRRLLVGPVAETASVPKG